MIIYFTCTKTFAMFNTYTMPPVVSMRKAVDGESSQIPALYIMYIGSANDNILKIYMYLKF